MSADQEEFEEFFRASWKRVLAYVERRVGNDCAADIAAEALVIAWQKWESRSSETLEQSVYWVLAIAKNLVLPEWRRAEAQRRRDASIVAQYEVLGGQETYSAERIALSKVALVESFRALSEVDRDVLLGRPARARARPGTHPPGHPPARRELGTSALAMRRSRARTRLRDGLREQAP